MNVTFLSNIILTKSNLKRPFELIYCEKPTFQDNLKIFGGVGAVTTIYEIQAKLSNRGTTVCFLDTRSITQEMFIECSTWKQIQKLTSKFIIWLNKTYGEWKNNKATISTAEDDTIELLTGIEKKKLITNPTKDNEEEGNDLDKKIFRAMRKSESWFNPQATKEVEDYNHGREMKLDQVNSALFSTEMIKEPTTYEEAINSEQKEDQIKWKNAINKEFRKYLMRKIFQLIVGASKINGYSKWKEMGFSEQDLWHVATVKSQGLIFAKVLHHFWMM
jgi:hypothetical protein